MSSAWSMPLRALATQTAVITMIGLGLAAPASAAPGDTGADQRSDTATTAQAEASEQGSTKASGGSSTSTDKGSTTQSSATSDNDPTSHQTEGTAGTRGTPPEAQPLSDADQNDGGANGECPDGPYCGTKRDEPSQNGEGDGEAKGKPCAGCVGAADNKNPKGQYDDADTDGNMMNANRNGNAGYECDRNKGIAKGNPAHTGCDSDTTVATQTCPDGSPLPASGKIEDCAKVVVKTCPDGSPLPASGKVADCDTAGVIPPGIGGVDTEVPPTVTPPVVKGVETLVPPAGVELYRPPARAPEAAPAQAVPGAAVLPATGAAPAMAALSALALGMLALGSGVLLYRRFAA